MSIQWETETVEDRNARIEASIVPFYRRMRRRKLVNWLRRLLGLPQKPLRFGKHGGPIPGSYVHDKA